MSYKFFEDFSSIDDNGLPYSIFPEETTRYDKLDIKADKNGYRIIRKQSKQILCTPNLSSFELSLAIIFERAFLTDGKDILEWSLFFGYSRQTRCGKELRLSYNRTDNFLFASLFDIAANKEMWLQSKSIEDFNLKNGIENIFKFNVSMNGISLCVENKTVAFDTKIDSGMIALSTQRGVEGIVFKSILLSSDCDISFKTVSSNTEFTIPCLDGGEIDYTFFLDIRSYENNIYEISCVLDGGSYHKIMISQNVQCWSAQYEHIECPYIRFIQSGTPTRKFYINNGKLYFVAKDYKKFSLEDILDSKQMPYSAKFFEEDLPAFDTIAFGYSAKRTFGNEFFGGRREFVFDTKGNILYCGEEIGTENISTISSNEDKQIINLIPEYVKDRDKAIEHAKKNHAFIKDESIAFSAYLHTKKRADRIIAKAELLDTFFRKICDLDISDLKIISDITDNWGYSTIKLSVLPPRLSQGVYHLRVIWYYGDAVCNTHESAFEIIDPQSKISPQKSSGLPFMYVGDGGPRDNTIAVPDMWNQKEDFNIEHYFDCAQYIPDVSESKMPWELLRVYNRKIHVWLTQRTTNDWSIDNYPLTIKNSDYLNYPLPAVIDSSHSYRADLWCPGIYDSPTVREIFEKFRKAHPEFEDILACIPKDTALSIDQLKNTMPYCFDEWTRFFNSENEKLMTKQWEMIKAINPKIKRSDYGPFPLYGTNLSGGYHIKWFGIAPDALSRLIDGFCQLEDYPFVCAYGTHYSAWGMMTIKHMAPDVKIAPELYDSFDAVCPDGFVAGAHPPLGESHAEPYMTVTQIYEYLYNTPILRSSGRFTYWQDNCLMFYSLYMKEPEERMKQFLLAWGNYLENRPLSPKRSIAYLYEFDTADNRRETDVERDALYNICQSAESYIHGCAAEAGLPAGFTIDYLSIEHLNCEMTDILVLPSLRLADKKVIAKIRDLYKSGVALIATGNVSGLEDIFGVKDDYRVQHVSKVFAGLKSEYVFPYDAEFFYSPDTAEVLLHTDTGAPVLMKNRNAILLNCSVGQVGVDNYKPICYYGRPNISSLLKEAISKVLCSLSRPYAKANGRCGVTSFVTESGDTDLLLVDYSEFNNLTDKEICVELFDKDVKDISCISRPDITIEKYFDGASLSEFKITIKHHEALLFRVSE